MFVWRLGTVPRRLIGLRALILIGLRALILIGSSLVGCFNAVVVSTGSWFNAVVSIGSLQDYSGSEVG